MRKIFSKHINTFIQNKREQSVFALILFLAFGLYQQSFTAGFFYDDFPVIVDNPFIKHLDLRGIWRFDPARFLTNLSFALNYSLFSLDVFFWHCFNVLVHALNAFFVYLLAGLIFQFSATNRSPQNQDFFWPAFLSAIFFLIHPLQTQAVIYLVQRGTLLSTLMYLAAVYFYLRAKKKDGRFTDYIKASIFCLMGLFTKPLFVTLPLTLLMCELIFFRKENKATRKQVAVFSFFSLPLIIIPLFLMGAGHIQFLAFQGFQEFTYTERLLTQPVIILDYIRMSFFPAGLSLDYVVPLVQSATSWYFFLPFTCIIGTAIFLLTKGRCFKVGVFSFFWFLITLSPVIVFPLRDLKFDHWVYLPSAGLFIGAVYYVHQLSRNRKVFLKTLAVLVIGSFSIFTYQRAALWSDEVRLMQDVVKNSPNSYRGYSNLGSAYFKQKRYDKAKEAYIKALKIDPEYFLALNNLANVYLETGFTQDAVNIFQHLTRKHPYYIDPIIALAHIAAESGNEEAALKYLNRALNIDRYHPAIYSGLGDLFKREGLFKEAKAEFQKAIFLKPENALAYYNLGNVYVAERNYYEALYNYEKALYYQPDLAQAHNNIGNIYYFFKNYEKAMEGFTKAVQYDPDLPEGHYNLANVYHALGDVKLSRKHVEIALKLYEKRGDHKRVAAIKKVLAQEDEK